LKIRHFIGQFLPLCVNTALLVRATADERFVAPRNMGHCLSVYTQCLHIATDLIIIVI